MSNLNVRHLASKLALRALLGTSALCLALSSQATVLQFTNFNSIGWGPYGDRVTSFNEDYGSAGGATPNIVLDFVSNLSVPSAFSSGYASLSYALGHSAFNVPGYIQFTPDPGFDVVLSSFQVAGWSASSYPNSRIQVVDTAGVSYFDSGLYTMAPNTVIDYLPSPIRSTLPLRLFVNDFGNLGIDNVLFSQVATIPEPSIWAMWLAGLAVLGGLWRRGLS